MDADPKAGTFTMYRHADRLHGAVELIDAGRLALNKKATGLCESDASCVVLEQDDSRLLFQRPEPRAYAGLASSLAAR